MTDHGSSDGSLAALLPPHDGSDYVAIRMIFILPPAMGPFTAPSPYFREECSTSNKQCTPRDLTALMIGAMNGHVGVVTGFCSIGGPTFLSRTMTVIRPFTTVR